MKTTTAYYSVLAHFERNEGRDIPRPIGIHFEKEEDAIAFVMSREHYSKYGVMGSVPRTVSNARQWFVRRVSASVYESLDEYEKAEALKSIR